MTRSYQRGQFDLFPGREQACIGPNSAHAGANFSAAIVAWAKRKWPRNAASMLGFLMGVKVRAAYYYVEGRRQIPARGLYALLSGSYGPEVMDALYGADPNHWWVSRKDRQRMDTLASGLHELQNEIEQLKRRRP